VAIIADIEVTRGDTPAWNLAVTQGGSPFDLTGCQLYLTAKNQIIDLDPGVFQLTIGSGITVTNAAGGLARVQLRRADTAALSTNVSLVYDIQLSIPGTSETYTLVRGNLTVVQDVTRAP
jgi:hypothetical protein